MLVKILGGWGWETFGLCTEPKTPRAKRRVYNDQLKMCRRRFDSTRSMSRYGMRIILWVFSKSRSSFLSALEAAAARGDSKGVR